MSDFVIIIMRQLNYHSLFIFLLLLITAQIVCAQSGMLTGKVYDENDRPMAFAHVLLLRPQDSVLVKGTTSDNKGEFVLNDISPGSYLLNVSVLGYEYYFQEVGLKTSETYDAGMIQLKEASENLEGVEVTGKKPLFERKTDRVVVNVKNSVTSVGGTALQVLEKSPGISVNRQSGTLSMNGKDGVLVMIDNKISRMPVDAVVQMLNGMSAANIERIELISNPPAKYDAEGNAGIVHILLVENENMGTSGDYGATLGYNVRETWGSNLNLNHRKKELSSFLSYSVYSDKTGGHWEMRSSFDNDGFETMNESRIDRINTTTVHNLRLGTTFPLGQHTTAHVLATGYMRRWVQDAENAGTNSVAADSTITFTGNIWERNVWQSATGSIGVDHMIKEGKEISATFDYLYYFNDQPSRFDNTFFFNGSNVPNNEIVEIGKETPIGSWIGRVDYSHKANEKFSWETGIKASLSSFDNDVMVERTTAQETVVDPAFTNSADLREDIWATYLTTDWSLKENWRLNMGLRYERTITQLDTPDEGRVVDRNFGNLFPNVTLEHNLSENKTVSAAYSRRITRPTYNDLAPFVFFASPTTFFSGNASLFPSISDNLEFTYRPAKWWATLRFGNEENAIAAFQPSVDPETGNQVFSAENLDFTRTWSLQLNVPLKLTSWWEWQNDFSFNHLTIKPKQGSGNALELKNTNFMYNGTITFLLPKDFSLELSGNYQGKTYWGINEFNPLGRFDIGLKKNFKNGGALSMVGIDIFNTYRWSGSIHERFNTDLKTDFEFTFGLQGVVLSYSRPFGNKKLKEVNIESGSEEERKRVNR